MSLLVTTVFWRIFTHWHQHWGATEDETSGPLPGDDLISEPDGQTTRAITIAASPTEVWPWIMQIGADRGGFYSYEWLENLLGLDIHNVDRIVDAWQTRNVGDLVYADAKGSAGWYVMEVVPNNSLVLKMGDVNRARPFQVDEGLGWEFCWTFVVRKEGPNKSRLLVRERFVFANMPIKALMAPVGLISFIMTRKMLEEIKFRSETQTSSLAQSLASGF